jgi:hypothetical protein
MREGFQVHAPYYVIFIVEIRCFMSLLKTDY